MPPSNVVTLGEVARRAGVSLATASRALNGSTRRVNADLARRVLEVARELGYVPNVHAQAVARGSSSVVGLVVHDIDDPYFSAIASGVMAEADRAGLMVTLSDTRHDREREIAYVGMLRAQRARAAILVGSRVTDRAQTARLADELAAFQAGGGRVACISQPRLPVDTVMPQNRVSARELARTLVDLGHRDFAVLAGPRQIVTAQDRLAGFKAGLADGGLGLAPEKVVHGPFTRDGGYQAAVELLAQQTSCTCVFAVNDVMAMGAMAALRERNVRVPADMSVAGFDDIGALRDLTPSLTTVRLPLAAMGEQVLALALRDTGAKPRVVKVPGEVVVRESTAAVTVAA